MSAPAARDDQRPAGEAAPLVVEEFLGEPTRDLAAWARLWTADLEFPIAHRGGLRGRLTALARRLLRPLLRGVLGDLYDRQRVFNLILLETLTKQREEYRAALDEHQRWLQRLDQHIVEGLRDVVAHDDALYARVDQKLDRYRREARGLWHRLGALVAAEETAARAGEDPRQAARASFEQQAYVELEKRWRGAESDIAERVSIYVPRLEGRGPVVDLGCGRGEALRVFAAAGFEARGVDSSDEMVAICREQGLDTVTGDLFDYLAAVPEGSLGGVVSFHVIEHLPPPDVFRLARLAWRALRPGGLLVLETPSPLSLRMAARDFWIDPTHLRPVHPAWLEVAYREAGFEPVERLDLHPVPESERLPEIDLETLPADQRPLADAMNRLRDRIDALLLGARDFAMLGEKPA
ncbi:MAG: class I SAM-dependent methyltransferase [Acidobacteriota bacterium]